MTDPKRKMMKGTANSEWMSGFLTADELAGGFTGVEISAGDGHDGLSGTAFDDLLRGEVGNDQLHGNAGSDTLLGGEGDDTSYGGDGDDLLEDFQGRNGFYGGNGNDIIRAGAGNDTIAGEGGDDRVWAGEGHNTVWLGEGHDVVEAGAGNDTITGEGGNDEIRAGGGDNTVYAGSGNDTVVAGDGRDLITGDDGNDSIQAGGGNDTIYAGAGDDVIGGGSGGDFITSDSGHDVIRAGSGSDTVYAGDGNDRLIQDAGENIGASDLLDGGSGFDTLVLSTTEEQFLGATFQKELATYQAMIANGSSAWQQFRFTSLGLTVNGFEKLELVNHGPSAFGDKAVLQPGTEDTDYTITAADLIKGYRDVDGDTMSVSGLTATHGSLLNNGNGTWTFKPDANYHGPVELSYRVEDGRGGETAATQSFQVAPVNDVPTISGAQGGIVTELPEVTGSSHVHSISGTFMFGDPDTTDIHSASYVPKPGSTSYLGTLSLDPIDAINDTIGWKFEITDSVLDSLAAGETRVQEYLLSIDDGNGGVVSQTVEVTLKGSAEPTLSIRPTITVDFEGVSQRYVYDGYKGFNYDSPSGNNGWVVGPPAEDQSLWGYNFSNSQFVWSNGGVSPLTMTRMDGADFTFQGGVFGGGSSAGPLTLRGMNNGVEVARMDVSLSKAPMLVETDWDAAIDTLTIEARVGNLLLDDLLFLV
ncbi:cadherin-like domain-containing protein [Chelativorans sp.]|uniref:cadherin-like domain-containing protein n=1 Tax=Chelativorans sp. TaxID=2203393 RepID=UPI00281230C8|nr:cadherin-like domain-containing protein [Chelativorans sp.]